LRTVKGTFTARPGAARLIDDIVRASPIFTATSTASNITSTSIRLWQSIGPQIVQWISHLQRQRQALLCAPALPLRV